jgi:hypothetical protein
MAAVHTATIDWTREGKFTDDHGWHASGEFCERGVETSIQFPSAEITVWSLAVRA